MPRPLNWIRGEGTTKNQRGLGDLVTVPSQATISSWVDPQGNWNYGCTPGWDAGCSPTPLNAPSENIVLDAFMNAAPDSTPFDFTSTSQVAWLPLALIGGVVLLLVVK